MHVYALDIQSLKKVMGVLLKFHRFSCTLSTFSYSFEVSGPTFPAHIAPLPVCDDWQPPGDLQSFARLARGLVKKSLLYAQLLRS
jgi:hypothetical protein